MDMDARAIILSCVLAAGAAGCSPDPTLWIDADELPAGRVDVAYDAALVVRDAVGEARWSVVDGALPPGLDLADDGVISGVPEAWGTYGFTVEVGDDLGEDEASLAIDVTPILLMSGFGPFDQLETNPSIEALWPLDGTLVAGFDVRVVELPVTWDVSWELLLDEIERLDPLAVVATGVATGHAMRLETRAVNEQVGTDVEGVTRSGEEIVPGGPDELGTGLPVAEMAEAMEDAGHAAMISDNAGNYLCNDIFYRVMTYAEFDAPAAVVAGFVHVPSVPAIDYELEDVTDAHVASLGALWDWIQDPDGTRRDGAPSVHTAPVY